MYQKFIHDYLEGNLSKEEVDFLFAQLPNDNDLKKEFESQQDLLNLIKQDKINTTTPVGLTASLFSKLNYGIPFEGSKILSKNKNYRWVYSALLLLLFVVSIPLTVYFTENDNILENSIKSNIIINKSQIDKNYNIPVLMNQNLTNNEIDNKVKDNFYYQQNLLLSDKHLSNKQNLIKNEQNYNDKLVNNSFLKIQQVNHSYFINSKNENLSIFFNNFVKIDNKINNKILMDNVLELNNLYKLKNLEIYFDFKNNLNNEPNIKLNNSSSNLTNLNLGLKYKLTENSKIGFEIGQENFTQNFRTFDGLIYQQSPNLLYLGLNYTYLANFIELPTDATPYAQISALATTIGPIFKINSGFSLFANNNFSINLGIEYLSLFYIVNSNIYNSSKINVTGGLVFKF
jgi:hypothetical protein